MAILTHKCPHCLTDNIALTVVYIRPVDETEIEASVCLECPRCNHPSGAVLLKGPSSTRLHQLLSLPGDLADAKWILTHFWPALPPIAAPELLPADVERAYLQAEHNFQVEGNEEAAGTMYRKALDVGLKKIDPSLSGPLGNKLKALAKAGRLTHDIADWSDEVRDLGNEAAHDEDAISRPDLETLRSFTEMVLRYLFTLPEMVKQRRAAQAPPGGVAS
jgi:hypothetical protein